MADHRPIISFQGLGKKFYDNLGREKKAVYNINIDISENEFVTVIGPSGCGKTTLLRFVAGLLRPTEGCVRLKGKVIEGVNTQVGFITQESNLFPWLTLVKNVEYPLMLRKMPKEERRAKSDHYLKMVGLTGFEGHYPHQLSGGMQKRGSIIRTLIYEPDVILMDEPFGPLDAQTRLKLQGELLDMWSEDKKTIFFVTHDLVEAIALADKVVLMTHGPGTVKNIFEVPIPRPRDVYTIHRESDFIEIYDRIWNEFKTEMKSEKGKAA